MSERMSQSQKRSYKRHHGLIDDVAGIKYPPTESQNLVIAHIRPVAMGGNNTPDNLFLTHRTIEDRINEVAFNMVNGNQSLIHGAMEYLCRTILQLNEASNFYDSQE